MQIIVDEIDGIYYADVILTPNDMQHIRQGEMLTNDVIYKHRKCYVGVRLQGEWDYDEKPVKRKGQGEEGDDGIQGWLPEKGVKGRPRRSQ